MKTYLIIRFYFKQTTKEQINDMNLFLTMLKKERLRVNSKKLIHLVEDKDVEGFIKWLNELLPTNAYAEIQKIPYAIYNEITIIYGKSEGKRIPWHAKFRERVYTRDAEGNLKMMRFKNESTVDHIVQFEHMGIQYRITDKNFDMVHVRVWRKNKSTKEYYSMRKLNKSHMMHLCVIEFGKHDYINGSNDSFSSYIKSFKRVPYFKITKIDPKNVLDLVP